jgi:L-ribulose-5-phosphate 4-epimerase
MIETKMNPCEERMQYREACQQILDTVHQLVSINLIRLSAGNISVRLEDGTIVITPSSIGYDRLMAEDMVLIDLHNQKLSGSYQPSSEKALHTAIYRSKPEVNAVVHTHSMYATAFSSVNMELPVISIEVMSAGGPIPVAAYRCPGTDAVGEVVVEQFRQRPGLKGVMMKNHGLVTFGPTLEKAYQTAYEIETGAQIYHLALQTGRQPEGLTPEQVQEIHDVYQSPKKN